ncbi:hypothetical protein ABW19_dt0209634 [Dactylella cylindrospora]|nr:hypothetical protein ABW19_dt0209634 [Dactylella cylindrospora]
MIWGSRKVAFLWFMCLKFLHSARVNAGAIWMPTSDDDIIPGILDARSIHTNPAHLFSGLSHENPVNLTRRHDFEEVHQEIIISAQFPTYYDNAFNRFFRGVAITALRKEDYVESPQDAYNGHITVYAGSCRPFYVECYDDNRAYIEACNFSGTTKKFNRAEIWRYTSRMMSCRYLNNKVDYFEDQSQEGGRVDWGLWREIPRFPYVVVPGLIKLHPKLVGYTFQSNTPEYGVAWYFMHDSTSDDEKSVKAIKDKWKIDCKKPSPPNLPWEDIK